MNIGIIGLGKMGESIAYRLRQENVFVFGFDLSQTLCQNAAKHGVIITNTVEDLLKTSDIVWIMVPVAATPEIISIIQKHAKTGTIVIDGGNSYFKDSQKQAKILETTSIHFLDCGTSGGIWGRQNGFCLMVGGKKDIFDTVKPYLDIIAAPGGVLYTGPSGSGHYVKMVHNGIEYGIMQSYAEGFHVLQGGEFQDQLNLKDIATVWSHGSVIQSWLLELTKQIFEEYKDFDIISGAAQESGMGKWTIDEAKQHSIPISVIESAYKTRKESQKTGGNFATKLIALMRNKFGGHTVGKKEKS
jgi:6-phosphogluconate dehydrogenase